MNVFLTLEVPESAVPVLQSLAGMLRAGPPPAQPAGQNPLQVIDAIIAKYDGLPNAQLTMARDTDSRSRDWVLHRQGYWPLKAVYFLAMNTLSPGRYRHPRDFHSNEARSYFESLGLTVVRS